MINVLVKGTLLFSCVSLLQFPSVRLQEKEVKLLFFIVCIDGLYVNAFRYKEWA